MPLSANEETNSTASALLDQFKGIFGKHPGYRPGQSDKFIGAHPETLTFVQAPKPSPFSFATEPYFAVNAFRFINSVGSTTYVRYRIVPVAGNAFISEEELKSKSPTYLFDELPKRIEESPIELKLIVQVAKKDDVVDDATYLWPDDRETVQLGTLRLDNLLSDDESKTDQKGIIFDPIPRVQGIEASADPLLDFRAALYLISGRERRQATYEE